MKSTLRALPSLSAVRSRSLNTMAPPARRLQTPVRLVLDWDGTLTVKDTMSFLGRLPDTRNYRQFKAAHPRHVSTSEKIHQGPRDSSLFGEPASWQRFSDVYMSDYVAHKAKHFPHGAVDQQMFRVCFSAKLQQSASLADPLSSENEYSAVGTQQSDTLAATGWPASSQWKRLVHVALRSRDSCVQSKPKILRSRPNVPCPPASSSSARAGSNSSRCSGPPHVRPLEVSLVSSVSTGVKRGSAGPCTSPPEPPALARIGSRRCYTSSTTWRSSRTRSTV